MLIRSTPLAEKVIGCAIEVHKALGPGLLESAYEQCLARELLLSGLAFAVQMPVPMTYKGVPVECVYRADIVVEDELLLEIKSVERLMPIHDAQVLTYLKLLHLKQGMLMNFNERRLVDGLKNILL